MYCRYCGNELKSGARFCSKCGKQLFTDGAAPNPGATKTTEIIEEKSQPAMPSEQEVVLQEESKPVTEPQPTVEPAQNAESQAESSLQPQAAQQKIVHVDKPHGGLIALCVIGWLAFCVALGIALNNYSVCNKLEAKYYDLNQNYNKLDGNYNKLNSDYNDFLNAGPWVEIVDVYRDNRDYDLIRSKIKYLYFDYKIYSRYSLSEDLKVRIIEPWGTVSRGTGSPAGYSFTLDGRTPLETHYGNGWGNNYPGTYARGRYTIEIWYQDRCVGHKVVAIK